MENPEPDVETLRPVSSTISIEESGTEEEATGSTLINDDTGTEYDRWEKLPKHLRPAESSAIPRHHEKLDVGTIVQLCLLLCKSMKMVWRYKILLIFELLMPIVGVTILTIYTATLELDDETKPIVYIPFGYDQVSLKSCKIIQIAGNGGYVDDIITELQLDTTDSFHLEYNYVRNIDFDERLNDGTLCAIVNFVNLPPKSDPLPVNITYELRFPAISKFAGIDPVTGKPPIVSTWETTHLYPSGAKVGPRNRHDNTGGIPGYYSEGFLFLQHKIDCILLHLIYENIPGFHGQLPRHVCRNLHVSSHFQRFPHPPNQHVNLAPIVSRMVPLVFVMSYLILFASNTWLLVQEKEVGMKGLLEYYDLSPWKQWLAWVTYKISLHSIALIPVAFILTGTWAYNRAVINKTSTTVIYVFMLTYVLNCICTSSLFSTCFYKARTACGVAVAIWIICYLPVAYVEADIAPKTPRPNDRQFSILAAVLYCFLTNFGLSYGFQVITNADVNSNGVSMDTMLTERFDLGHVILCLNAMSLFSIILAIYIERVSPTSRFMLEPVPLHYFFSLRWWMGHQIVQKVKKSSTDATPHLMEFTHPKFFEKNPKMSDRGVELSLTNATRRLEGDVGITKINFRCVSGEIVCILGPEKSGKTAFFHVCAGLLPVTEGSVSLKKRNMKKFMSYTKANVGICPQIDALYDYLTVEEHLSFFVQVKGVIVAADAYEEIENLIAGLDLEDIRKVRAKNLSRGQKRLVHIAIAFAGGSKTVLLDEPTDGMDVPMQRTTWRFLDSERYIRSILLFTKSGDEASYISDRVLVLVNGEVYTRGTPSFIKTTFDSGYHLELTSKLKLNKKRILISTKKVMPRSKLLVNKDRELKLLLPDEYTPFFPSYFENLTKDKAELGIEQINISYVPFEEILKRVTTVAVKELEDKKKTQKSKWKKVSLFRKIIVPMSSPVDSLDSSKTKGIINALRQFYLMTLANVRFSGRRWKWNIFSFLMVTLIVFFGPFFLEKLGLSQLGPLPGAELHFQSYENPRALFKCYDKYKMHEEFCLSVRQALTSSGLTVDDATAYSMDRQLLGHYNPSLTAQDIPYSVAADVKFKNFENDVVLYFDNQPLHILPIGSTFFTKLLYLRMRKASFPPIPPEVPEYEIHVINRPLPYTTTDLLRISRSFLGPEMLLGTAICWGSMFYLPSNLAFQFQKEKHFKILMKSFGMNIYLFWFAKLLWNMFVLSVFTAFVGPAYYALGYAGFDNWESFVALYVTLLCWSFCIVSIVYSLSFLEVVIRSVRSTFFYVWMISIAIGPIPWTVLLILTEELYDEQESTKPWLKSFNWFLMLCPGHALAVATHRISIVSQYGSRCASLRNVYGTCNRDAHPCCDVEEGRWSYFTFSRFGILDIMILLVVESVSLLTIIFIIESSNFRTLRIKFANFRLRRRLGNNKIHPTNKDLKGDDELVRRFKGKDAKSLGFEILINNLTKRTDAGTKVDGLTLGIRKHQCVGFIGTEASGQSTVLRILAGLSFPTSGDITIDDISLVKSNTKYVNEVSVCPKQDMLFQELTGRETLMLVGTAKGITIKRLKELIHSFAIRLDLVQYLDKLVLHYELGWRRKLAFALALLGHHRVLVLEEPFTEIDPESQVQMMKILTEKKGRITVVISSANMEISAYFCDRIVLLLDGKLALMGSPSLLMSNYSKGLAIIIQLVPEDASFYGKKGIVYKYEGPPEEPGSNKGSKERIVGKDEVRREVKPQGRSQDVPAIVISGAEDEIATSQRPASGDKNFLSLPVEYPGQNRSASSESGESSGGSRGSSWSSYASSGPEDELWEQELDPVMEYMEDNFPNVVLFDKSSCYLHYHLQDENMNLGDVFRKMEIARIAFELEAYRVGTGTISQLLGSYTRGQSNKNMENEDDK